MKKIVFISTATAIIGITSFAYFSSHSFMRNEVKAVDDQKHVKHSNEEIPSFPKATHTAQKIDDTFSLVTNPDSPLVLVNKHRKLPDGHIPKDLIKPNVPFTSPKDKEKTLLRKNAPSPLRTCSKSQKKMD